MKDLFISPVRQQWRLAAGGTYYHGTNVALADGESLHPAAFTGVSGGWDSPYYSSEYVYLTTNLLAAERFAWLAVKHHGGEPHIYEVSASNVMPDPEQESELGGFSKDNFVSRSARVVGEVDLPGHTHYDGERGGFFRGPKTAGSSWRAVGNELPWVDHEALIMSDGGPSGRKSYEVYDHGDLVGTRPSLAEAKAVIAKRWGREATWRLTKLDPIAPPVHYYFGPMPELQSPRTVWVGS
jgi:hypothetical protein